MCELANASIPVVILVELEEEERLIDWETDVVLPTLIPIHKPLLPLEFPHSTE